MIDSSWTAICLRVLLTCILSYWRNSAVAHVRPILGSCYTESVCAVRKGGHSRLNPFGAQCVGAGPPEINQPFRFTDR
eukprot:6193038-Pleurochrysis_carterae.AAC.1